MILLEELVKRGVLKEEQVSEVVKIAEEKYDGSIDQALLNFNLNEEKILEIKGDILVCRLKILTPKVCLLRF